jgi:hypothetical protein
LTRDPNESRYLKKFPRFPGLNRLVDFIRHAQGTYLDMAMADLAEHADLHLSALIAAFEEERDPWIRALLLSVIADAPRPAALDVFQRHLIVDDEHLRYWALVGLHNLATPEARRALWDARSSTLATPEQTESFRQQLADVMKTKPGSEPPWWTGSVRSRRR